MPLKIHRTLLLLLTISLLLSATACGTSEPQPVLARMMTVNAESPAANEPDLLYSCNDGSLLFTYRNADIHDFIAECRQYETDGYTPYSSSVMGNTVAATYVRDRALVHVYWHITLHELNVAVSQDAGATLPPVTTDSSPAAETAPCTVTQMMDGENDIGMGYIVQLTDGSYIIYDGSFAGQAEKIKRVLLENHTGEGAPLVRAWVLTHSHLDHIEALRAMAEEARRQETFTVEYFIVSPMNHAEYELSHEDHTAYLSTDFYRDAAAFTGSRVVFAHTGMTFTFGNLRMEVLYAPESLFKTTDEIHYFNNTSLVTRLYDENYSALFLGDVGEAGTNLMVDFYGDYIQSDMCQISHHGLEDVPLSFYDRVRAPLLFYPCSQSAYDQFGQNGHTRRGLQKMPYTKEILIAGLEQYTRAWGTVFDKNAPLSMPDYIPPEIVGDELPTSVGRPSVPIDKTA